MDNRNKNPDPEPQCFFVDNNVPEGSVPRRFINRAWIDWFMANHDYPYEGAAYSRAAAMMISELFGEADRHNKEWMDVPTGDASAHIEIKIFHVERTRV